MSAAPPTASLPPSSWFSGPRGARWFTQDQGPLPALQPLPASVSSPSPGAPRRSHSGRLFQALVGGWARPGPWKRVVQGPHTPVCVGGAPRRGGAGVGGGLRGAERVHPRRGERGRRELRRGVIPETRRGWLREMGSGACGESSEATREGHGRRSGVSGAETRPEASTPWGRNGGGAQRRRPGEGLPESREPRGADSSLGSRGRRVRRLPWDPVLGYAGPRRGEKVDQAGLDARGVARAPTL